MWAITLCSVCPTSSGSTRKAASTDSGPHGHLEQAHRGPHSGGGTPGACTRRRLGDFAPTRGPRRAPCRRATAWRRARRAGTTCAAACPRTRRAAAAGGSAGRCRRRSRRSRCRTSRRSRARARRRPAKTPVTESTGSPSATRVTSRMPRSAPRRAHVEQVRGDVEPRRGLVVGAVDGAEPVEEGEALVARGLEGGAPRPGLDHARLVSHVGSLSMPVPAPPDGASSDRQETTRHLQTGATSRR